MSEPLTFQIDTKTGALIVEGLSGAEATTLAGDLLSTPVEMGCAKPVTMLPPPEDTFGTMRQWPRIRVSGYYHDSLVEGPGRRSVVRMQGCPIHCPGCWVPETWDMAGGTELSCYSMAHWLLDPEYDRDGVTILGGEPFAQPRALDWLIYGIECVANSDGLARPHLTVFTGYTYEVLAKRGIQEYSIRNALSKIDLLIDGPYIAKRAKSAGPWTGSGNQRVVDMAKTREAGKVVQWEEGQ